jgi:hypothetical protein
MSSHLICQSSFLLFLSFDLVTPYCTHQHLSSSSVPFGSELCGPWYRTSPSLVVVIVPLSLDDVIAISVNLTDHPSFSLFLVKNGQLRDQEDETREHTVDTLPLATLSNNKRTLESVFNMVGYTLHDQAAKVGTVVAQHTADTLNIGPSTALAVDEAAASMAEEMKVGKDEVLQVRTSDVTDAEDKDVCLSGARCDTDLGHVTLVDGILEVAKHAHREERAGARTVVITRL